VLKLKGASLQKQVDCPCLVYKALPIDGEGACKALPIDGN